MLNKLWIDGKFVAARSGRTFAVVNPADGSLLARVAEGGAEDINDAVEAAVKASIGAWSKMHARERVRTTELVRFQSDHDSAVRERRIVSRIAHSI